MSSSMIISGLASGIDTENIIKQLMDIERIPIKNLEDRKLDLEARRDAWRDINTRISSLDSTLTALKLESTYTSKLATSSSEEAFTAAATSQAVNDTYSITVNKVAKAHTIVSTGTLNFSTPLTGDFTVNGVAVSVNNAASLDDIRDAINNTTGVDAKAIIIDGRLVISHASTGVGNDLSFGYLSGDNILKDLGIYDSDTGTNTYLQLQAAQDAEFVVNGLTVTRQANTISDVIEGVTLTLKNATGIQETLTVANDTQKAIDKIQAFVDQYNSVMDFISQKLYTDTELEESSDSDVGKNNGTLQGDPTLSRIQNTFKSIMSGFVFGAGTYTSLSDIGITTGNKDMEFSFDPTGKLTVDTDKLREALETDPVAVKELFFNEVNVASAANGGTVAASSEHSSGNFPASSILDGDNTQVGWGSGNGWNDDTQGVFPDWVEISFTQTYTLEKIKVFTLDSATYPADQYGIKDYELQYWDGAVWQTIETVTGNTQGEIEHYLNSIKTEKIKIQINDSNDGQYARLVEVEAYTNGGLVAELSSYIDSLITAGTGILSAREEGLEKTLADIDEQIEQMEDRLALRERNLQQQFLAMERAISTLKNQSNWLAGQIASLPGFDSGSSEE